MRSLEGKSLIVRAPATARPAFQRGPAQDRIRLTVGGATAVAALLALPPAAPASAAAPAMPRRPPRRARHEAADQARPPAHPAHERRPSASGRHHPQGPAINATTSATPHQPAPAAPDTAIRPALRALSLGAGVRSSALLCLSADGTLPKIDIAVFADTGWEPKKWAALQHETGAPDAEDLEAGVVDGCSPWACRDEQPEPARDDFGLAI
ncbi:hypothetical protein [Streptomyces erythrochromogenes]|uniref:hypothetical protein n=1 Tax=Streptomyces erythrochromogenes TaxID=285574 RepID=UPI00382CCB01